MTFKTFAKSKLNEKQMQKIGRLIQHSPKEFIKDIVADAYLLRVKRKSSRGRTIRVGFIVQMAEIWDKESPVYDAMVASDSFSPHIIVVPSYDQVKREVNTTYENNYFLENYSEAIRAFENESWIDLKKLNLDYIFLQRPYDHYLPQGFRSGDIAKHSKVCYIPYGFSGADVFNGGNTNKSFFRNVYFSFLESDHMVGLLKSKFKGLCERRLHKILNLGYPALIPYFSIPKREEYKKILWTPRWSFDPIIGGSNFLKYKDSFLHLAEVNCDKEFVFRPHPLLYEELQVKGLMTEKQIDDYKKNCCNKGINFDKGRPVLETFADTDILITDYSSIIIQFFITGRPIVYCNSDIELNELYIKLSKGFYVANNVRELEEIIKQLIDGKDVLFETRQKIIREELRNHMKSTRSILKCIQEDAQKN